MNVPEIRASPGFAALDYLFRLIHERPVYSGETRPFWEAVRRESEYNVGMSLGTRALLRTVCLLDPARPPGYEKLAETLDSALLQQLFAEKHDGHCLDCLLSTTSHYRLVAARAAMASRAAGTLQSEAREWLVRDASLLRRLTPPGNCEWFLPGINCQRGSTGFFSSALDVYRGINPLGEPLTEPEEMSLRILESVFELDIDEATADAARKGCEHVRLGANRIEEIRFETGAVVRLMRSWRGRRAPQPAVVYGINGDTRPLRPRQPLFKMREETGTVREAITPEGGLRLWTHWSGYARNRPMSHQGNVDLSREEISARRDVVTIG